MPKRHIGQSGADGNFILTEKNRVTEAVSNYRAPIKKVQLKTCFAPIIEEHEPEEANPSADAQKGTVQIDEIAEKPHSAGSDQQRFPKIAVAGPEKNKVAPPQIDINAFLPKTHAYSPLRDTEFMDVDQNSSAELMDVDTSNYDL